MSAPRIVYFGQTPGQGTGSPVILLRHLQRLANQGWGVSVVGERGTAPAEAWPFFQLSLRKAWWPPFRPANPLLRALRMRLWARECAGFFATPPQAIITYLSLHSELLSEVAAHYARLSGVPLTVIVHDYPPDFPGFQKQNAPPLLRRQNWILAQAQQTWFVSPELADCYNVPEPKKQVLMPIPEGCATPVCWNPDFAKQPVIVYAGYIYPAQMPLFSQLARTIDEAGGRLLLLSKKTPDLEKLCRREPVESHDLFPTNREALDYVSSRAAALLVSYSENAADMPWITTSFPSKLVEFAHTGLPTLIVAPKTSAIAHWARQRNYPDCLALDQLDAVRTFVEALKNRAAWSEKSDRVTRLAQGEFNPDVIQQALESSLTGTPAT